MKKALIVIAILVVFLSSVGTFVFRQAAADFKNARSFFGDKNTTAQSQKPAISSENADILGRFDQKNFVVNLTEGDLQKLLAGEGIPFFDQIQVAITPRDILLKGKGRHIISYSLETKVVPKAVSGNLVFETQETKVFGLKTTFFKDQSTALLNDYLAGEINKKAYITGIALDNQRLTISGEQK